jgi:hypothetical protein
MNTFKPNKKNNISNFVSINEVINYDPPKYIPNWDGSFKKIKSGKSNYLRPNKEISTFNIKINNNNSLRLDEKSEGIYIILSDKFNFFYVGKTLANIKQRLHSHIQKLTSTNNNRYTTPFKWQKLSFNRYKVLKEDSVKLDDLKIKFYNSSEYSLRNIDELEKDIYRKYKALLPNFISLNDPKALEN